MLYHHITELIGNTPLLQIDPAVHQLAHVELYAKLELLNPFGSLKDRTAWGMLQDDIAHVVQHQQTIVEFSSGNTAKALALLASVFGVDFTTITNRIKVPEVQEILTLVGATIETLPGNTECPDYAYLEQKTRIHPEQYYHTDQYRNAKNYLAHYTQTGREIDEDIGPVDYFYGGLGTAGSTRGVGQYLKEKNPALQHIGVVAELGNSIPGLRNIDEMAEMGIFEQSHYQECIAVDIQEALTGMFTLIKRSGVLGGPSSGAVYQAIIRHLKNRQQQRPITVVFIVCDRVEWYLSYIHKHRPEALATPTPTQISTSRPSLV